jgi:hypothetical protein
VNFLLPPLSKGRVGVGLKIYDSFRIAIEDLMDLRVAKEEDAFSAFCALSRGEENVRIREGCGGD